VKRGRHPSSRLAFAFEAPRISVIIVTPTRGALPVARFLVGLGRAAARQGLPSERTWVNGQPGAVTYGPDGRAVAVMALDVLDGRIVQIHAVVAPAKLAHVPGRAMS
jgi:hypothetical protein